MTYNLIVTDSGTYRQTNNPAYLFRWVLQHPANPRPVPDSEINLTEIEDWAQYCDIKEFTFNAVVSNTRSILDVLRDIAAAGRASPAIVDGKWTVKIDRPISTITQHFSKHNSWGFEATRVIPRIPDGLRCIYRDESSDWENKEIIVFKDNNTNINNSTLFETIELPGITRASLVYDHLKWHFAQIKLRREIYTIYTDLEYLVCNRGDRVKITHDVPQWGLGSGRIKSFNQNTKILVTNEYLPYDPQNSYTFRVRTETGTSEVVQPKNTFAITKLSSIPVGPITQGSIAKVTYLGVLPFNKGDLVNIQINTPGLTEFSNSTAEILSVEVTNIGPGPSDYTSSITYNVPIRQYLNTTNINGIVKLLPGNYNTFSLIVGTTLSIKFDDIFLYGYLNQESQDLIVLSVEPEQGKTAKLTLIDYGVTDSYNIFTDYLTLTGKEKFESQITQTPYYKINVFEDEKYKLILTNYTMTVPVYGTPGNLYIKTNLVNIIIDCLTFRGNQVERGYESPTQSNILYSFNPNSHVYTTNILGINFTIIGTSGQDFRIYGSGTVDTPFNYTFNRLKVYAGTLSADGTFRTLAEQNININYVYAGQTKASPTPIFAAPENNLLFSYSKNATVPYLRNGVVITENSPIPLNFIITPTEDFVPTEYIVEKSKDLIIFEEVPFGIILSPTTTTLQAAINSAEYTEDTYLSFVVKYYIQGSAFFSTYRYNILIANLTNKKSTPEVLDIVSDESVLELISNIYRPNIKISVDTDNNNLPATVDGIEIEYGLIGQDSAELLLSTYKTIKKIDDGGTTSIILKEIIEGEKYYYRLRYVTKNGIVGPWSNVNTHTVVGKTTPPSTVTGFNYTILPESGKILLSWNANTEIDVLGYEIRTADEGWGTDTNYLFIGSTTSHEIEINTTTNFWIKAFDACNPSKYSVNATNITVPISIPGKVTNLSVSYPVTNNESSTELTLTWSPPSSTFAIKHYKVRFFQDLITEKVFYVTDNIIRIEPDWFDNSIQSNTVNKAIYVQAIDIKDNIGLTENILTTIQRPNEVPSFTITETQTEKGLVTIGLTWSDDQVRQTFPIAGYEIRTSDQDWEVTVPIYKALTTSTTFGLINISNDTTWYIRAFDTLGLYSNTSNSITYSHIKPATPLVPYITRRGVYLIIKPDSDTLNSKFSHYEIRIKKGLITDTEDFWDSEDIIRSTTLGPEVAIDLREFTQPRMSLDGINYRIAMRIIDIAGASSATSVLSSYLLKTIKC